MNPVLSGPYWFLYSSVHPAFCILWSILHPACNNTYILYPTIHPASFILRFILLPASYSPYCILHYTVHNTASCILRFILHPALYGPYCILHYPVHNTVSCTLRSTLHPVSYGPPCILQPTVHPQFCAVEPNHWLPQRALIGRRRGEQSGNMVTYRRQISLWFGIIIQKEKLVKVPSEKIMRL